MKTKFNWDDDLPKKKRLEFYKMIIVVKSVFHKDGKYYLQFFLDKCL